MSASLVRVCSTPPTEIPRRGRPDAGCDGLAENQSSQHMMRLYPSKVGPGLGRGLHDGAEAGDRDAVFGLDLVRIGRARGVPKGVFSCVTGPSNEVGGELTSNRLSAS